MNLAYPLDETIEIDGKEYQLNLSFDNVLRLFDMLNDKELMDYEQIILGLEMLIGTDLPEYDIEKKEEIFHQIFTEIIAKDEEEEVEYDLEGNPMPKSNGDEGEEEERVYSIKQDAPYIFASFYQDYGIDLFEMQGKLHWVKFKALLAGLRPDTKFKEVVGIRTMELPSGKGTEKERERVRELKRIYRLKDEDY